MIKTKLVTFGSLSESLFFFFFSGAAQSNANDQDASLAHLAKTEVSYLLTYMLLFFYIK